MLGESLGHGSKVEGEGKEGRTPLLISVDLASYLYRLEKVKRKEGHRRRRNVTRSEGVKGGRQMML